jgi:hypothetical protein
MKRTAFLILTLLALVALCALTRSVRAQYVACQAEGFPGGYVPYCVGGAGDLVGKTWLIPSDPPEALYELCGSEAAYGRLHLLQPLWRDLSTYGRAYDTLAMPEAAPWAVIPTRDQPCAILRVPVTWPGGSWVADLEVLEPVRVYVPLVKA